MSTTDIGTTLIIKPSRAAYMKHYLLAVILGAFLAAVAYFNLPINQLALIAAAGMTVLFTIIPEFHILRSTYIITPTNVIIETGIIKKKRVSISMMSVADVEAHQNPFQRILKLGNIFLRSASGQGILELHSVRHPTYLVKRIERIMSSMLMPNASKSSG